MGESVLVITATVVFNKTIREEFSWLDLKKTLIKIQSPKRDMKPSITATPITLFHKPQEPEPDPGFVFQAKRGQGLGAYPLCACQGLPVVSPVSSIPRSEPTSGEVCSGIEPVPGLGP